MPTPPTHLLTDERFVSTLLTVPLPSVLRYSTIQKQMNSQKESGQVRLSGADVSAMDKKRVGLISVYDALKVRIENGTTVAEFDAIEADIISDLTWSTEKSNG